MTKTALITGISGQDGAYLSKHLLSQGYKVFGGIRKSSNRELSSLKYLQILDDIELIEFELQDEELMRETFSKTQPDEVYNLAAMSFVGASFLQPKYTLNVNGSSIITLLDLIRNSSKEVKLYQASSSEMFGGVHNNNQSEETQFHPQSPYAAAKVLAHELIRIYRDSYNLPICSGILFNHESPLRGDAFVTKKIVNGLIDYKLKCSHGPIELGNIYAERDWGAADEYCEAMYKMLQLDKLQDFVISTGETNTVKKFIEVVLESLEISAEWVGDGLEEKLLDLNSGDTIVLISKKYFRPIEVNRTIGNSCKAHTILNWRPKRTFEELISWMTEGVLDMRAKR